MTNRVACPRCGQDYLQRVELVALGRTAIHCPECDALWLKPEDVGPPTPGGYGVTWFDYGTYMQGAGRQSPHQKGEVRVLGHLLQ
jgi:hypothetical protein